MSEIIVQCGNVADVWGRWVAAISGINASITDYWQVTNSVVFLDAEEHPCVSCIYNGDGNTYIFRADTEAVENPPWQTIFQSHGWHQQMHPQYSGNFNLSTTYILTLQEVATELLSACNLYAAQFEYFAAQYFPVVVGPFTVGWTFVHIYTPFSFGTQLFWLPEQEIYRQQGPYNIPHLTLSIQTAYVTGGDHPQTYIFQDGGREYQSWGQKNPTDVVETSEAPDLKKLVDALRIYAGVSRNLWRGRALRVSSEVPTDVIVPDSNGTTEREVERLAAVCEIIGRSRHNVVDTNGSTDPTTGITQDEKAVRE